MGRLSQMNGDSGTTVATAVHGPAGEVTSLTYDGFSETRTYNSLLQLTRMTAVGGGTTVMDMQYTFSGTENNGRITLSTDGTVAGGETVVYTYDTLNRLTKAETTSEAYTYDGFGNLTSKTATKGTAPAMSATYDAATNHQTGTTYDANGNPGYGGAFPYDVENHLLQPLNGGTGPQWTYDGSGKRVFAKTPGNGTTVATACEIYYYGITGKKLVTFQCGYNDQTGGNGAFWYQVESRNLYFGGKLMRSAGVTVVTDRLGSVRANSNGERMSYFPYGEERTSTTDGREKFGTYFRDPSANGGLDYADQRYYSNANGRFLTADPYAATTSSPTDSSTPGSWNRYAYVQGDPVNYGDPEGMIAMAVGFGLHPLYLPVDPAPSPEPPPLPIPNPTPNPVPFPGPEPLDPPGRQVDSSTNSNARGLLATRLKGFQSSNCWNILSHEGVKVQNIVTNYSNENFYDVEGGSAYADLTLAQIGIAGSGNSTLNEILNGADAKTVGTLGSVSSSAVLLGAQYFYSGNTDAIRMNSLLHEMLHALGGFTDTQILNDAYFLQNGLVNQSVGNVLDTSGITDWLGRDCK
jgi:RHS repeat-associated protein